MLKDLTPITPHPQESISPEESRRHEIKDLASKALGRQIAGMSLRPGYFWNSSEPEETAFQKCETFLHASAREKKAGRLQEADHVLERVIDAAKVYLEVYSSLSSEACNMLQLGLWKTQVGFGKVPKIFNPDEMQPQREITMREFYCVPEGSGKPLPENLHGEPLLAYPLLLAAADLGGEHLKRVLDLCPDITERMAQVQTNAEEWERQQQKKEAAMYRTDPMRFLRSTMQKINEEEEIPVDQQGKFISACKKTIDTGQTPTLEMVDQALDYIAAGGEQENRELAEILQISDRTERIQAYCRFEVTRLTRMKSAERDVADQRKLGEKITNWRNFTNNISPYHVWASERQLPANPTS